MDWLPALIAAVALPAGAAVIGLVARARSGRVRQVTDAAAAAPIADLGLNANALGDAATLVQFSTAYCGRCPATARQLAALANEYDGVRHIDFDLTHRPELADRFRVLQTPTTLLLGAEGALIARIGGLPRIDEVRTLLDALTRRSHVPS